MSFTHVIAQNTLIDEKIKDVMKLIMNKEHDRADSILDNLYYNAEGPDQTFVLNLTKCYNGYEKIKTYEDPSVIRPYSDYGKKVFLYLRSTLNKDNAQLIQLWPTLSMLSEIYNYLDDSVVVDISGIASDYYIKYNVHDLFNFYNVQKNTYQYLDSRGEWKKAADVMKIFYDVAEKSQDTTVMKALAAYFLGEAYQNNKKFNEAEYFYTTSYQIFNSKFINEKEFCCKLLEKLIITLYLNKKYSRAIGFSKEHCDICKLTFGDNSLEFCKALTMKSDIEIAIGKIDDAVLDLENAVKMFDNFVSLDEPWMQRSRFSLNFLKMYFGSGLIEIENNSKHITMLEAYKETLLGNFSKAKSLYKKLLTSLDDNLVDNTFYCYAISELSLIMLREGNYSEADSLLNYAMERLKEVNPDDNGIRFIYETKGSLFQSILNQKEALRWFNLAKGYYSDEEKNTIGYARLLSNIALCLDPEKDLSDMKSMIEKAYNIYIEAAGNYSSNDKLILLNNLGWICMEMGDYDKSQAIFELLLDNCTTKETEMIKSGVLSNLSKIYLYKNLLDQAEIILDEATELKASIKFKIAIDFYALLIKCMKRDNNLVTYLGNLNDEIKKGISDAFGTFSGSERESYWTKYSELLSIGNNYVAMNLKEPQTSRMAFDNLLLTKNMLLKSEILLEETSKASNNSNVMNYFSSFKLLKKRLSEKGISDDSTTIIIDSISNLEKKIIAATPNFGARLFSNFKKMEDIKDMISGGEVAIEFTLLPHVQFPLERTNYYLGAFILKEDSSAPILVEICPENDIENLLNQDGEIQKEIIDNLYSISDSRVYQIIWTKIKPFILDGSTIYYSPSGVLNKINLSLISNGTKRLSEIYNIFQVSSTAQIEDVKNKKYDNSSAVIYGDINYYENVEQMSQESYAYKYHSSSDILATRSLLRGTWDLIPGTKHEIKAIDSIMRKKGIRVLIYDQDRANEESFKSLDGKAPDIIHVSTHGFYYSPNDIKSIGYFLDQNPTYTLKDLSMLHCGLLFAGANNAWTGKSLPNGIDDGILTAEELSHIDLRNNKLVVLSACDTGLGDIDSIDGVFGLQRALKRANAGTIMMSLWKIPDEETKELMTTFYKCLLSGFSVHDSLKYAQKELNDKGKSPYYWAGFVILD